MNDALARWPVLFAVDALRYAIPASLAFGVFWIWKWDALAHRRIQRRRPSRNAFRREIRYSISTAIIFATVGTATVHLNRAGVLHIYADIDAYGWPYWALSIGLAILFHDAYFYWTHRAMHHPWLFARVHRVHHLSTSPSPWAAYAFAPAEAVVSALVVPIVLLVLPMHQSAMFVFLRDAPVDAVVLDVDAPQPPSPRLPRQLRSLLHVVGPRDVHAARGLPGDVRDRDREPARAVDRHSFTLDLGRTLFSL